MTPLKSSLLRPDRDAIDQLTDPSINVSGGSVNAEDVKTGVGFQLWRL